MKDDLDASWNLSKTEHASSIYSIATTQYWAEEKAVTGRRRFKFHAKKKRFASVQSEKWISTNWIDCTAVMHCPLLTSKLMQLSLSKSTMCVNQGKEVAKEEENW